MLGGGKFYSGGSSLTVKLNLALKLGDLTTSVKIVKAYQMYERRSTTFSTPIEPGVKDRQDLRLSELVLAFMG